LKLKLDEVDACVTFPFRAFELLLFDGLPPFGAMLFALELLAVVNLIAELLLPELLLLVPPDSAKLARLFIDVLRAFVSELLMADEKKPPLDEANDELLFCMLVAVDDEAEEVEEDVWK
jgi:hypothetical protein